MDGDGQSEAVTIHLKALDQYYYDSFQVSIDGKQVLSKSIRGCYGLSVRYLSCSSSKNYLQFVSYADGGYMYLNRIYCYSSGKLVKAADFGTIDNASVTVTKVTKSGVTVKFSVQPWQTGRVQWSFVYQPSGSTLKVKNNTVKIKSTLGNWKVNDGYTGYFKKNQFVAAKKTTFYTSTSLKKAAFTTKAGDVLTLQKVKVVGKKMYLSFKKNGKTGWIRIKEKYSSNALFYGVTRRLAG
jgi:hypothetical protein